MFLLASQHHKRQVFQLFRMSPKHTLKLAAFSTNFPASCAMVSWAALDHRQNEWSTASALKLLSAGFPQQTKWAARNTPFCGPSPSLQPTSTHRNACCMFWFTLFLCQLSIAFLCWLSLVFAFWLPFSRASPCCFEFCFFWFAVPVPVSKLWCSSPSLGRPWFCPLNSYSRLCFPRAGLYAGANPGPISPIARDDMLITPRPICKR